MSNFYAPVVNNNGDTFNTLDSQYKAVADAAKALIDAMCAARPHGRNYQTLSDDKWLEMARDEWQKGIDNVVEIEGVADYVRRQIRDDTR